MRGLLEWADGEGLVRAAATEDVPRPQADGKTYRVLRPRQVDELIQAAAARQRHAKARRRWLLDLLNFNPCAGLRIAELYALRWADIGRLEA